jgi:hypothetical protein
MQISNLSDCVGRVLGLQMVLDGYVGIGQGIGGSAYVDDAYTCTVACVVT